ncbi:prepilin-type N-terminal cleavage/methylation domain-containing protein [Anabaena sp. UHCC 0187]|nr:hormogonium polysaccharide secretion pseudopilin HpsC [Anabaena sp. UHCC 0187]MTJ12951.1 prepilin-type N-terminal cleavage/methylation domain-containing protein [Anabaena sp. UHCC 0187]
MKTLKFILRSQIKSSKVIPKSGGFTLIELLVALVISFLILTPLLGFMISVMTTDRDEQVKANSEEEIQTALNYISRDLQQAIYIYDQAGITAISSQLRYPSDATKTPLLVFWKRDLVTNVVPTASGNDDTFVYSLVAYYLDNSTSTTWSKAARISRWQIKDGVESSSGVTCGGTKKYVNADNCPTPGFAPFDDYFDGADGLEAGMNKWKKSGTYTTDATVLIDYVDQSTTSVPAATCPADIAATTTTPAITWSTIKPTSMTGFYVCVDKANTTAQVFIRGNAMARLDNDAERIKYSDSKKSYFPATNVRVQGRGFLYK